jgi:hypothetical protein
MFVFLRSASERCKSKVTVGSVDFAYGAARVDRETGQYLVRTRQATVSADPRDWGSVIDGEKPVTLALRVAPELSSLVQHYAAAA